MKSWLGNLKRLMLPFNAGISQRIVLDGVLGEIDIYNSSNVLKIRIAPNGIVVGDPTAAHLVFDPAAPQVVVYDTDGTTVLARIDANGERVTASNGGYVQLKPNIASVGAGMVVSPPLDTGHTLGPGYVYGSVQSHTPTTTVTSPIIDSGNLCGLSLSGQPAAGGNTFAQLFADKINLSAGITAGQGVSFDGASYGQKVAVTGSRGGNAALANLLTALASYGLILDSTS